MKFGELMYSFVSHDCVLSDVVTKFTFIDYNLCTLSIAPDKYKHASLEDSRFYKAASVARMVSPFVGV